MADTKERNYGFVWFVVLALVIGFGISRLDASAKETWQPFYYPEGCLSCEDDYVYGPVFNSSNECIQWAEDRKRSVDHNQNDLYECGKNCAPDKDLAGMYLCEETID